MLHIYFNPNRYGYRSDVGKERSYLNRIDIYGEERERERIEKRKKHACFILNVYMNTHVYFIEAKKQMM